MKNTRRFALLFLLITSLLLMAVGVAHAKKTVTKTDPKPVNLKFKYYNELPGEQELNLIGIEAKREITGIGVISPDMEKVAYSEVYFYPQNKQTSSKVFYIKSGPLDDLDNLKITLSPTQLARIFAIKRSDNPPVQILSSGTDSFDSEIFRTLTIVDWSADNSKLLVKEAVGEHYRGIWVTNLWVYDFEVKKAKKLDEVRKAIVYHWKNRYRLDLRDYSWDIVPLGWDLSNPDMIVVNAYGYNYGTKEFLGCWGIDSRGRRTQLLSLDNQNWPVGKHGYILAD